MRFTKEQLEKIISEAPEGATHIAVFMGVEYFWVGDAGSVAMWSNGNWSVSMFTPRTKLIELAEQLQEMKMQESKKAEIDNTAQQVGSLAKESERDIEGAIKWKRGDKCLYKGHEGIVIEWHPEQPVIVIDTTEFGIECATLGELSKPLTLEQKQQQIDDKNRLEAAYDLYCDYCEYACSEVLGFHEFRCKVYIASVWLSIVDKTNYRKDESI